MFTCDVYFHVFDRKIYYTLFYLPVMCLQIEYDSLAYSIKSRYFSEIWQSRFFFLIYSAKCFFFFFVATKSFVSSRYKTQHFFFPPRSDKNLELYRYDRRIRFDIFFQHKLFIDTSQVFFFLFLSFPSFCHAICLTLKCFVR